MISSTKLLFPILVLSLATGCSQQPTAPTPSESNPEQNTPTQNSLTIPPPPPNASKSPKPKKTPEPKPIKIKPINVKDKTNTIFVGKPTPLSDKKIQRISVGDSEIFTTISGETLGDSTMPSYVIANKTGTTTLTVLDEKGRPVEKTQLFAVNPPTNR